MNQIQKSQCMIVINFRKLEEGNRKSRKREVTNNSLFDIPTYQHMDNTKAWCGLISHAISQLPLLNFHIHIFKQSLHAINKYKTTT